MTKTQSKVTTLDDEASPDVVAAGANVQQVVGTNHDEQLSGSKRTITIHPADGDGGTDAVSIGLNGYMYQIPRGKPVEVPAEVYQILLDAKQTLFQSVAGGGVVERVVQRFAFSAH
ncbi:MAG: hypothetical protein ABI574_00915 [Burkholderiales bacterium]